MKGRDICAFIRNRQSSGAEFAGVGQLLLVELLYGKEILRDCFCNRLSSRYAI